MTMNQDYKQSEVIGQLAATVAHELRVPLTVIKNSIYFMKMIGVENCNPKVSEHIALINQEIDRCVQMITNMQHFVQPTPPVKKEIRLEGLMTESLSQMLVPSTIRVRTEFSKDLPSVVADPFQIRLAFDNVLRNAIASMKSGGSLTVNIRVEKDFIVTEVSDTGAGIPTEQLDKIFSPLFSATPHGIGLGLAVCKQSIDAHGGNVTVTSQSEHGTTVRMALPLR